jgi:release factor glutamine methyltransferase
MHIRDALADALARGLPRLDAQLLLAHVLARPRVWLLAHDDEALSAAQAATWAALVERRLQGEPVAYLVGEREFHGLALQVSPTVLVPRPETELLVAWALECLTTCAPSTEVVDLGTGSGAVALAVKQARPAVQMWASDASADALSVARGNAQRHGLAVSFVQGDWWAPLAGRRFGLALSNPPYVASDDPHLAALAHEPLTALTPGGDGLGALRQIIDGAPDHLWSGAWLLLEHGHDQAEAVRLLLQRRGFAATQTRPDLAGLPRCSGGCWPAET